MATWIAGCGLYGDRPLADETRTQSRPRLRQPEWCNVQLRCCNSIATSTSRCACSSSCNITISTSPPSWPRRAHRAPKPCIQSTQTSAPSTVWLRGSQSLCRALQTARSTPHLQCPKTGKPLGADNTGCWNVVVAVAVDFWRRDHLTTAMHSKPRPVWVPLAN